MGPVSIPEEVIMCKPHCQGSELVNGMVFESRWRSLLKEKSTIT